MGDFLLITFAAFSALSLVDFFVFSLATSTFSLILKVFIIGQEKVEEENFVALLSCFIANPELMRDAYSGQPMGLCGEVSAEEFAITRYTQSLGWADVY